MKQAAIWIAVVLLAFAGCKGREKAEAGATETIAPASPQPATDSEVTTQTVDVEDSRSEAEGGALNTTATTGTTENPTTTVAPPTTTTH